MSLPPKFRRDKKNWEINTSFSIEIALYSLRPRNEIVHCTHACSDGTRQEIGSCMKDFRNKPNPVKMRIIYLRGTFEVGHVTVM